MNTALTDILPFNEWKEKIVIEPSYQNHNAEVCFLNVEGRTMMVETTCFPHFGLVMAAAMCPDKYNADPKTNYSMTYVDEKGEYCIMNDEDTYAPTGRTVTEVIDGLTAVSCYYYTAIVNFSDYDKACLFAYELYLRRRRNGLEVDE